MEIAFVLVGFAVYFAVGARQARKMYTRLHHAWWDKKIVEHRQWLKKSGKKQDPEETMRVLRKKWESANDGQAEAVLLAVLTFLAFPVLSPIFALARDPAPSNEEQKLINEGLEAEIDRLNRQLGE